MCIYLLEFSINVILSVFSPLLQWMLTWIDVWMYYYDLDIVVSRSFNTSLSSDHSWYSRMVTETYFYLILVLHFLTFLVTKNIYPEYPYSYYNIKFIDVE